MPTIRDLTVAIRQKPGIEAVVVLGLLFLALGYPQGCPQRRQGCLVGLLGDLGSNHFGPCPALRPIIGQRRGDK